MVLLVAVINIAGATFIDRIQSWIVIVLLAVFAVFIVVTLAQMDPELLAPSTYPPTVDIISSVALTFFAFLGFAVISFTGGRPAGARQEHARATYLALAVTTALYVLVSLGVFGTLTVQEVIENGDTALAVAAKPALGQAGFAMMAVAALLGDLVVGERQHLRGRRVHAKLAETGQFPPVFGDTARIGGTRGLVISCVLVLVLANLVDLTAIASLGSVVALSHLPCRSIAALQLRAETHSNAGSSCLLLPRPRSSWWSSPSKQFETQPQTFVAMVAILSLAIVLDLMWAWTKSRREILDPSG